MEIGTPLSFQWTPAKEARTYRLLYRRRLGPNETVLASPAPRPLSGTAAPTASPTAYRATFGPRSATPPPTYGAGVMDVLGGTAGGRRRQEASCLINGELEVDVTVRAHTSAGLVLGAVGNALWCVLIGAAHADLFQLRKMDTMALFTRWK